MLLHFLLHDSLISSHHKLQQVSGSTLLVVQHPILWPPEGMLSIGPDCLTGISLAHLMANREWVHCSFKTANWNHMAIEQQVSGIIMLQLILQYHSWPTACEWHCILIIWLIHAILLPLDCEWYKVPFHLAVLTNLLSMNNRKWVATLFSVRCHGFHSWIQEVSHSGTVLSLHI